MRRNLAIITSIFGLAFSTACKKEEKGDGKPPDNGSAKVDPNAGKTTDTPPDGEADSPLRLNDQKHCPSAVETAETKVEKGEGSFTVSITTKKLAQVKEVRTRGMHLVKASEAASDKIEHTGEGTGGGLGKCPVVLHKTKVTGEELSHGIKLTITPDDAGDLDKLLAMAEERAKDMNARGGVAHGSGAGIGKGEGKGGGKGGKKKDGAANPCNPCNPCGGAAANPCGGDGDDADADDADDDAEDDDAKPAKPTKAVKKPKKPAKKKEGGW